MRIGFFTDSYLPDTNGVAISVETCAQALRRRGHTVTIIAPKHPKSKDGTGVIRLASVKVYNEPELHMALHLPDMPLFKVLRHNFDIIHAHGGGPVMLLGWEMARLKNIPYITTYHTMLSKYTHYVFKGRIIRPRMMEWVSRVFGNMCDCIIAPTTPVKDELLSYGVKKPIIVLPSGIDVKRFQVKNQGFLRKKLGISPDTKILLCVARLGHEKSLDVLIKAFQKIHEVDKNTALVLVGDGPQREKLKKLAKNLKLNHSVYFTGHITPKNLPGVYKDANLFVFTSQTETQGLVIYEALAAGLPVVAIENQTFNETIQSGKNGYLVTKADFAKTVISLLKNQGQVEELAANASASATQFSIDETVVALENLYSQLITKNKKARKGGGIRGTIKAIREYLDLS